MSNVRHICEPLRGIEGLLKNSGF